MNAEIVCRTCSNCLVREVRWPKDSIPVESALEEVKEEWFYCAVLKTSPVKSTTGTHVTVTKCNKYEKLC